MAMLGFTDTRAITDESMQHARLREVKSKM